MITINVCIGSACHLKGSYAVIKALQELIEKNNLNNEVEIKGNFCCGNCVEPVSVKINDGEVISVTPDTVEEFFNDEILGRL